MPINRYFLSDFVTLQRQSFFELLEKGIKDEFLKRNVVINTEKNLEFKFYADHYVITRPEFTPQEAIIKNKSYTGKLFVPAQLTDLKHKRKIMKWFYIGNLPLMTKRGHFILNGAARVIVNQILRSPGIYYQQKIYENYEEKYSQNPDQSYKRFYADLICMRGTWLRIEVDKQKNIWAQTKKGPKIPIYWFLVAMGLSEKKIFKTITDSHRLLSNLNQNHNNNAFLQYTKQWPVAPPVCFAREEQAQAGLRSQGANQETTIQSVKKHPKTYVYVKNPPEAWQEIFQLIAGVYTKGEKMTGLLQSKPNQNNINNINNMKNMNLNNAIMSTDKNSNAIKVEKFHLTYNKSNNAMYKAEEGRKWLINKFMSARSYDLGKQGRMAFNKKLAINVSTNQTTLTGLDVLYATDYLLKVEKGIFKIDDIDHLKNRRVRTSGELIQIQIAVGIVRLEKTISETINKINVPSVAKEDLFSLKNNHNDFYLTHLTYKPNKHNSNLQTKNFIQHHAILSFVNSKGFNSAIREFFATSPLSQFMDQINPLAELTHKRRLSSMGPGGVTRDTATLGIRGIHATHYGRICPIETPEGKNTGLVNSMTTYARVNSNGVIESPFYRVYKGQVQKNAGTYYFSAEHEEKIKLAAADIMLSSIGFLPKSYIAVRIAEDFTKIPRLQVQYIGVSALQMISIAASLIPFLEHDDANRALMGSNMQRQAVPLIRPERPIVGTGLEARAVSDSGHTILAKFSGLVTYVSSRRINIVSFI